MKVVFATEYYHPWSPGGTAWSLELLARALLARGHGVVVVTPNYGAPAREEVNGVPVVRFPFWRRLRPGAGLAPLSDHVNPLFHLLFARALVSETCRYGADVLHAQEKHALVGAYLAGRWLGKPVFLSLRDFGLICPITTCLLRHTHIPSDCGSAKLQRECVPDFFSRYIRAGALRKLRMRCSLGLLYLDAWLKWALVRRVAGVTAVSRSLLDIYDRAGRIRADRGHVVYNLPPPPAAAGFDRSQALADFGLPAHPLVLYVGKCSPGKGFPVFAEAARIVTARAPETTFVAVGERPPEWSPRSAEVRLLGSLPHGEVERLYALADVVVHPAVWPEPFSRVPLEAAAFGKPVVGTRIGGTPEAVEDKVTGLLVERSDPDALARAIGDLLADPDLRLALGRRAAETIAAKFSGDRIVDELLLAYGPSLGKSRSGGKERSR
jgi:glycosyltransferase involved in cell wall biosynthesis